MNNNCQNSSCSDLENCQCGIKLDIYQNGVLVESSNAYQYGTNNYFLGRGSSVWDNILGDGYELKIQYNSRFNRWELVGLGTGDNGSGILGSYDVCNCDCLAVEWNSEAVGTSSGSYIDTFYKVGTLNGKNLYQGELSFVGVTYYLWWNDDWNFAPSQNIPPYWVWSTYPFDGIPSKYQIAKTWDRDCPTSEGYTDSPDDDWNSSDPGLISIKTCCVPCPTSLTDWNLCNSFLFQPDSDLEGPKYVVTWNGDFKNGRKAYYLEIDGDEWEFSWDGENWNIIAPDEISWSSSYAPNIDTICFPTGNSWIMIDSGDTSSFATYPNDSNVGGYQLKVSSIDCGCCDESVIVDINNTDYVAKSVKDEYGNILIYNGKKYYKFNFNNKDHYIRYSGTLWQIVTDCTPSFPSCSVISSSIASNKDCPYAPYSVYVSGEQSLYISVRGSECFDCCDYYKPRNRNLLKKKKAIFVDEISSIKSKEIFGLKCGPEWSDLFKKHLIFDTLWCLPYGVLCDDEEQCLINNLNENCNC